MVYNHRMRVKSEVIRVSTQGNSDIIDLTGPVTEAVKKSGLKDGTATVFVTGSTAGLTTIEFEPGLVHDLGAAFERLVPRGIEYKHHERWGDDNGHSHVRSSILGTSMVVPFQQGKPMLGTWQQIILVDFDTRPRDRDIVVQILGA